MRHGILLALAALLALAPAASAQTGQDIAVALLDTGVDPDHAELQGRVERHSFVRYGPDLDPLPIPVPLPDLGEVQPDPHGRGTAVASVVAGQSLGVAPGARILDLQVDAQYTQGLADPRVEEAAMHALEWLLQRAGQQEAPRVVVLGFASDGVTGDGAGTMAAQARALWDAGVAVVVPAAPESDLHLSRHVMTVAVASECPDDPPLSKPDVEGPGTDVEVAVPAAVGDGGTATASGSHLAAGHVAGLLALMFQVRPDLPVDAAFAILRAHTAPGECSAFGLVQEDAVAAAQAWQDPAEPPRPDERSPLPALVAPGALLLALAWRRR